MKKIILFLILISTSISIISCGETVKLQKKRANMHKYRNNKIEKMWTANELWEEKLKILSETAIPEINSTDELDEKYVIELARVAQAMSPEGLTFDKNKKLYVITEADVKYCAKFYFGLENFKKKDPEGYVVEEKVYVSNECPNMEYVNNKCDNLTLEKLDNYKWRLSVDIHELNNVQEPISEKQNENTNGFIREIYEIEDKNNNYKLISVKRLNIT